MKPYLTKILLFSVIISLLTYLIYAFVLQPHYLKIFPYIILFFTIIGIVFHNIILKISKRNISKFATYFMLFSTLKLVAYIILIVIYLLTNKENAIPFVVYFFILYIFYTAFEVVVILPEIKKK